MEYAASLKIVLHLLLTAEFAEIKADGAGMETAKLMKQSHHAEEIVLFHTLHVQLEQHYA